jgi:hypothetical protein
VSKSVVCDEGSQVPWRPPENLKSEVEETWPGVFTRLVWLLQFNHTTRMLKTWIEFENQLK